MGGSRRGPDTGHTMPRIIHCSDLILRINHSQEVINVTEWLHESTEFRPIKPETCEIRDELDNQQKILVIVMIWTFLVFLSIFYCYFCEQKLFPTGLVNRSGFLQDGRCPNGNCNQPTRLPEPELSAPYRSSQLKTEYQGLKSPPKNKSFSEELRVGEFRLLTN